MKPPMGGFVRCDPKQGLGDLATGNRKPCEQMLRIPEAKSPQGILKLYVDIQLLRSALKDMNIFNTSLIAVSFDKRTRGPGRVTNFVKQADCSACEKFVRPQPYFSAEKRARRGRTALT